MKIANKLFGKNKYERMELGVVVVLFVLMGLLSVLIIEMPIPDDGNIFTPSLFIAISALTASVAMTRSVYATKTSDYIKTNLERQKIRLELFGEAQRLGIRIGSNDFKKDDAENAVILIKKVELYFDNDEKIVKSIEGLANGAKKLIELNNTPVKETEIIKNANEIKEIQKHIGGLLLYFNELFKNYLNLDI